MKQKLLLSLLFLFTCGVATLSAQTNRGQLFAGGSLSYNYDSYGTTSNYTFIGGYTIYQNKNISVFNFNPEIGYFLSDNFSVSLQPAFSHTSGTEISNYYSYTTAADNNFTTNDYHSSAAGVSINIRYYWMITNKVGIFPQFGIGTLNNTKHFDYGTLTVAASPNIVFFPTPNLGINLGFGKAVYNMDYQTKESTFNAGLNNNFSFGVNYYW